MYNNYIFDLYGTLVDIHTDEENREVWEKLCLFYGYYGAHYSPEELKKAYKNLVNIKVSGPRYSHEAYPEIKIETIFLELFTAKNVQADETLVRYAGQLFRVLTTEYIRLYEGADRVLKQLHRQGKGVYLLTNAQRIFTEYELHMLNIFQYFDGILISSDWGVKKPDRRFFEILLEKYCLNPRKCIMIGNDGTADIAGAASVGMDTLYIHSNISPLQEKKISPTYMLKEMDMKKVCRVLKIEESQCMNSGGRS